MTRKELQHVKEAYRTTAKECQNNENPCAAIVGICKDIATEDRFGHHERGQRLWAFFQALEEESSAKTRQ